MTDPLRAKLSVTITAAVAFAFGLGMASALDFTPLSMAAGQDALRLTIGAPEDARVDVSAGFAEIVDRISPAVVTIEVEQRVSPRQQPRFPIPSPFDEWFREFDRDSDGQEPRFRAGSGSGFIVSPDGYIVTNNHVVEGASQITVQLHDQRRYENVEVVGRDPTTDVALLKVNARNLTAAPLGFADSARVGDWVLAIGSPGFMGPGGRLPGTVTVGIISAKSRNIQILNQRLQAMGLPPLAIEDFIQTDAAINPGNSGGPLLNGRGEVIGMNTAIASTTGVSQGFGFAVPIELVRQTIEDLVEYGEVRRAVLGVTINEVDAADAEYYGLDRIAGAKVMDATELPGGRRSPAERAGIRPGDVIVAVEGRPVESVSDLQRRIRGHQPGETVEVTVVRRTTRERERLRVTLAAADAPDQPEREREVAEVREDPLGLEVEPLTADLRRSLGLSRDVQGALITGVAPRGPGARAGLARGWVIVDVDGQEIRGPEDYRRVISGAEAGSVVSILALIPEAGQHFAVTVRLPRE